MSWQTDKKWSDRFVPELKRIAGEHLIGEAPLEEDAQRNTDLVVLKLDAVRIACRVRQNTYLHAYGNEFTVRSSRPAGTKTELTKIIEGWGDYLIYGFASADETQLEAWRLLDLNVFRLWLARHMANHKGELPGVTRQNRDGSSGFHVFDVTTAPPELVRAQKEAA